jgi:hypothetical protein
MDRPSPFAALLVALGIALAGGLIGRGFVQSRTADRSVSVKGVAERDIEADIALWTLRHVATGDDLSGVQARIGKNHKAILDFLGRHGIDPSAAQLQGLDVEDRHAQSWVSGPVQTRFVVTQTVIVRSGEPATVRAASQAVGELVDAGVVLAGGGGWATGPTYLFTKLNDFKPEMIAEATTAARAAAEKFAQDSGADLGGIRRANQGVFEILPRDRSPGVTEETQLEKTLRVVTTVEYLLE